VLLRLGVNVDALPAVQSRCLDEAGVCFCFAIHHHPAAKVAGPARRAIGGPTIFNLLGPLTNPAGAGRQLIGTYAPEFVEKLAGALWRLGSSRAMVVHGSDGMDEITTTGPTMIAHVEQVGVRVERFDAAGAGIARAPAAALVARDLDDAARMIREILAGAAGPAREIVLLNAAAALVVAGAVDEVAAGLERAAEALDSGRAARTLDDLARVSNSRP
jgi:anthranilate phosphoribosyltransferase